MEMYVYFQMQLTSFRTEDSSCSLIIYLFVWRRFHKVQAREKLSDCVYFARKMQLLPFHESMIVISKFAQIQFSLWLNTKRECANTNLEHDRNRRSHWRNNFHERDSLFFFPSSLPLTPPSPSWNSTRVGAFVARSRKLHFSRMHYLVTPSSRDRVKKSLIILSYGVSFPTRWLNIRHSTNWERASFSSWLDQRGACWILYDRFEE